MITYTDVEALVKAWALGSAVAELLRRSDGGVSIFMAMPTSAPNPALVLRRVGGAPMRSDLPEDRARVVFDCWGRSRNEASSIAYTLISELDNLARLGSGGDARLAAAEVVNVMWLPDPDSDTPRYVVDALITTLAA